MGNNPTHLPLDIERVKNSPLTSILNNWKTKNPDLINPSPKGGPRSGFAIDNLDPSEVPNNPLDIIDGST
jgi:hypothetical protein